MHASAVKFLRISSEAKFKHHFSESINKKLGQSVVRAALGLRRVLWPVERDDLGREEVMTSCTMMLSRNLIWHWRLQNGRRRR